MALIKDARKLTYHHLLLAVFLVQISDDGLVNYYETCSPYIRKKTYVVSDGILSVLPRPGYTQRDIFHLTTG